MKWKISCSEVSNSNSQKLQNPFEFTTKIVARPLPKYVTEAKKKFIFGDDDHEVMEATESKVVSQQFTFPISRRYFSFPSVSTKPRDYVVFAKKNRNQVNTLVNARK